MGQNKKLKATTRHLTYSPRTNATRYFTFIIGKRKVRENVSEMRNLSSILKRYLHSNSSYDFQNKQLQSLMVGLSVTLQPTISAYFMQCMCSSNTSFPVWSMQWKNMVIVMRARSQLPLRQRFDRDRAAGGLDFFTRMRGRRLPRRQSSDDRCCRRGKAAADLVRCVIIAHGALLECRSSTHATQSLAWQVSGTHTQHTTRDTPPPHHPGHCNTTDTRHESSEFLSKLWKHELSSSCVHFHTTCSGFLHTSHTAHPSTTCDTKKPRAPHNAPQTQHSTTLLPRQLHPNTDTHT